MSVFIDHIRELHAKGYTDTQIAWTVGKSLFAISHLRRRLGLKPNRTERSRFTVSKPGNDSIETQPRRCLQCSTYFASEGPGNRICARCKEAPAWKEGMTDEYSVRGLSYR